MTFRALALRCLVPRLAIAIWFSAIGYYGAGGDAETYHVLGALFRDQVVSPGRATIEARLYKERLYGLETAYTGHEAAIEGMALGDAELTWRSSVLPVVILHGLLYIVWDNPFSYVLLTSILSALATAFFVRSMEVRDADTNWFIYNPASIYFAATHFKESLTEVIFLLFIPLIYRFRRWIPLVILILLMAVFRFTYVPMLLAFIGLRLLGLDRVKTRHLVLAVLLVFLVLPPFYYEHLISRETAGPIYSLVYSTEASRKVLGPLLGLLLPMPFLLPLSYGRYIGGIFYTIYGLFYWLLLLVCAVYVLGQTRRGPANTYLNLAALAALGIGYIFVGGSGLQERYFAPVLPILILGFVTVKPAVLRLFVRPAAQPGIVSSPVS